jgi:hypothetical protein
MRTFTAVIEKCPDTGLYVGHVPGFPGATAKVRPWTRYIEIFRRLLACFWKMVNRRWMRSTSERRR